MKMNAIVTAGGIPQPGDKFYDYSNGDSKALIDVAGKPMVQWILDALGEAKQVDEVIVIGLSAKSGLNCKKAFTLRLQSGTHACQYRHGCTEIA